jgi:hypothetical protein
MRSKRRRPINIEHILAREDALIGRALRQAARRAVREHWAAGHPVTDWRDGRVVWIAPNGSVLDRSGRASKT